LKGIATPKKTETEAVPASASATNTNSDVVVKKRIRRTKEQLEADPKFRSRSKFINKPAGPPKEKPVKPATPVKPVVEPPSQITTAPNHNPLEENLTSLNVKRPAGMFTESDLTSFETIKTQPKIYNLLNQEDGSPIEATPMMRPMGMDFPSMEPEEIGWGLEDSEVPGFEMEQPGQIEGFSIPQLNLNHHNNIMNMNLGNILPFSIPQFPDNNGFNQM